MYLSGVRFRQYNLTQCVPRCVHYHTSYSYTCAIAESVIHCSVSSFDLLAVCILAQLGNIIKRPLLDNALALKSDLAQVLLVSARR